MDILRIRKPNRRWYEKILWWELRRIPYNIIMYFVGLASFYVGYVTIPLVYLVIGLGLNLGYTFCWLIELAVFKRQNDMTKMKYPRIAFISYLAFSAIVVFGFAIFLFL
jgi:hypothetical protein